MSTAILIPARLQSKRFPRKMLCTLGDKTLIEYVYEKCKKTRLDTYVLTDSDEIKEYIPDAIVTDEAENGTARCMSVINHELNYDKYVNVQGDMPDITEDIIYEVEHLLDTCDVTTVYSELSMEERRNPSSVKVIHTNGLAHWFCRASLSYGDHHLGVYGYTTDSKSVYDSSTKFPEEDCESLEQLRWLQNGQPIKMSKVEFTGTEINTPEDLVRWQGQNKLL